jgi:hypothetical protein
MASGCTHPKLAQSKIAQKWLMTDKPVRPPAADYDSVFTQAPGPFGEKNSGRPNASTSLR